MNVATACPWIEIGFIFHFKTGLVINLNYRAIVNPHALKITTAHAKTFQCSVLSLVVPRYWLLTV
jgi:hypothetical protein